MAELGIQIDQSSHLVIVGIVQTPEGIISITAITKMDRINPMRQLRLVVARDRISAKFVDHSRFFRLIPLNRILTVAVWY